METSHIDWVARKLNSQSKSTLCFLANAILPGLLWKLLREKADGKLIMIRRVCVTVNVGRIENRVYVGNEKQPGNHWSVVVIEIAQGKIIYCDSLGWDMPPELVTKISPLMQLFGKERQAWDVIIAHTPNINTTVKHVYTASCLNYPLQVCGSVCGIVAMHFMAICALE